MPAGFDAVILTGKSDRPTVLSVHPEGVDFHDAGDLWGMETFAAEEKAIERLLYTRKGSISQADMDYMLQEYYRLRGWDKAHRQPIKF